MKKIFCPKQFKILFFLIAVVGNIFNPVFAQNEPPAYVRQSVRAVEKMLDTETDDAITTFIDQYMMAVSEKDRPDLIKRLKQIRTDARGPVLVGRLTN